MIEVAVWRQDLIAWWNEGATASEISRRLEAEHQVLKSRNAVIAILMRARQRGEQVREATIAAAPVRVRTARMVKQRPQRIVQPVELSKGRSPASPPPAPSPPAATKRPGKSVAELRPGDCRWIEADPRSGRPFACSEPRQGGLPYCQKHARLAFNPAQPKRPPKPV